MHTVSITNLGTHGPHVGSPRVEVNGTDLANVVRSLTLNAAPGGTPTLELNLLVADGSHIEGQAEVTVPDATRAALIHLGWTPPAEAGDDLVTMPVFIRLPDGRVLVEAAWVTKDDADRMRAANAAAGGAVEYDYDTLPWIKR